MENFHYNELIDKIVKEHFKVDPESITKVNMKSNLILSVEGEQTPREIPIKELDSIVLNGCRLCEDLTSELADISMGAIGSQRGWNTVIIRTPKGKEAFEVVKELLEIKPLDLKLRDSLDFCAKRKRNQANKYREEVKPTL